MRGSTRVTLALAVASCTLAASSSAAMAASPAELYGERCARCHAAGEAGAPRVGDREEWARRIRPGMTLLYRSALEGVPNTQMLPKAGYTDLSEAEVKAIVDFMMAAAAVPQEAQRAARRYESLDISNRDFIRLDRNFDGRLSRDELGVDAALLENLARFDEDHDEALSVAEYEKLEATLEQERAAVTVSDETLVEEVREALAHVKGMSAANVKVESTNGLVTMTAIVADADTARRAYDAIRRIRGIKKIDNRLISAHLMTFD